MHPYSWCVRSLIFHFMCVCMHMGRFSSTVFCWLAVVAAAIGRDLSATMGLGGHRSRVFAQLPWWDGRQFVQSLFDFLQEQFLQCPQHMGGILRVPLKKQWTSQVLGTELTCSHQSPFCTSLFQPQLIHGMMVSRNWHTQTSTLTFLLITS